MVKRIKKIRSLSLGVLAAVACLAAFSAGSVAAAPISAPGMELEFAGDTAGYAGGQAAVAVECIGEPTGFCSGTLALTWHGKRSVSTFAVQGGHAETVFVPLAIEGRGRRAKVSAVATTSQPLGPVVTRKAVLHLG